MTMALPKLPKRDVGGHKGTFGTVAIVGGCTGGGKRMLGAPALAALGSIRGGAGLTRVLAPAGIVDAILGLAPSATAVALAVDERGEVIPHKVVETLDPYLETSACVVVGPGLGEGDGARALALRCVQCEATPIVVDADGLNALAQVAELHLDFRAPAILTPHPGEFRTLAASLRITADPVDGKARPGAAEALAQKLGAIVVLKGAGTVVSDGQQTWVCERGHPCLATGGTGDVLAGLVGAIVAQHVRIAAHPRMAKSGGMSLFDAARLAVEAHARAGEAWARAHHASGGMLPQELAGLLPGVMEEMRGS